MGKKKLKQANQLADMSVNKNNRDQQCLKCLRRFKPNLSRAIGRLALLIGLTRECSYEVQILVYLVEILVFLRVLALLLLSLQFHSTSAAFPNVLYGFVDRGL